MSEKEEERAMWRGVKTHALRIGMPLSEPGTVPPLLPPSSFLLPPHPLVLTAQGIRSTTIHYTATNEDFLLDVELLGNSALSEWLIASRPSVVLTSILPATVPLVSSTSSL